MIDFSETAERVVLSGLQRALDAYLGSDADAERALSELGAVTVAVEIADLGRTLFLVCHDGRLQLKQRADDEASIRARVSAPLKDFAALGLQGMKHGRFSGLTVHGEAAAVQELWNVLSGADFNCETFLARHIGDVAAHELGRSVRAGGRFLRRSLNALAETTGEYLQEEARVTPNAFCIQSFIRQVDVLRDDLDRLQARIRQQEAKRERS